MKYFLMIIAIAIAIAAIIQTVAVFSSDPSGTLIAERKSDPGP